MKIGICEDSIFDIQKIRQILEDWGKEKNIQIDFHEFMSGEKLLEAKIKFDVLFLDIQLPGINGDAVAQKVRDENQGVNIIFFTAYSEYMRVALGVHAFDYLEKPIEADRVRQMMDDLMALWQREGSQVLFLKIKNGFEKFNIDDILYFEKIGRELFVQTKTDQIIVKMTLSEIYEKVKIMTFEYGNKGCIINFAHVKVLKGNEILMTDGSKMFLSRSKVKPFGECYKEYIKIINN
ncbi:MAG: LytTR family DNA-binding domain-containing protein [Eubacterium sp.]